MTTFADLPLEEIHAAAVWAAALDPDVELVDGTQDDQPDHGVNTHEQMYGGPDAD